MTDSKPCRRLARTVPLGMLLLCALIACGAGCTHSRLQRKTINQGSTLTELQYQQVLDNLAMFSCQPDSLAWHIRINGGVVQVTDQGSGFFGLNLGGPGKIAPNLGLQTNILHQWNVDPVIEAGDLELLQLAYSKAIDPFDADGSIKSAAYDKICEIGAEYHITLARELVLDIIQTKQLTAEPKETAKLDRIRTELGKLYAEIDQLAEAPQTYEPSSFASRGYGPPSKLEFLKEEVIRLTSEVADEAVEAVGTYYGPRRNVGLIEQAQDKINALVELVDQEEGGVLNQFHTPWIGHGCKKDVPRCACQVGHYQGCGCDCYVWVLPDRMKTFRDFVLIVLSLTPPAAQEMAPPTPPGVGAANSPTL